MELRSHLSAATRTLCRRAGFQPDEYPSLASIFSLPSMQTLKADNERLAWNSSNALAALQLVSEIVIRELSEFGEQVRQDLLLKLQDRRTSEIGSSNSSSRQKLRKPTVCFKCQRCNCTVGYPAVLQHSCIITIPDLRTPYNKNWLRRSSDSTRSRQWNPDSVVVENPLKVDTYFQDKQLG